jgi:hypothetical protein
MKIAINSQVIIFLLLVFTTSCNHQQNYTVGNINDPDLLKYPVPGPVHPVSRSFVVTGTNHVEEITVNSTHLRNLSITIENSGNGVIKEPHLFGPQGWDVRGDSDAYKALATNITQGNLTKEQKFFRAFEWTSLHIFRAELTNAPHYVNYYHAGNASRLLNQYGACMCGEIHQVINPIYVKIPGAGMYGTIYGMGGHNAGGVFWDGKWHDYNGTPDIQIVHYKMDGKTIATWEELKKDPAPIDSMNKIIGRHLTYGKSLGPDSKICPLNSAIFPPEFYKSNYLVKFRYSDLRPDEKMTLYFDMRGRFDSTSARINSHIDGLPRSWVDYGSVVYTYKPNFHNARYEPFVVDQSNVRRTEKGIVPVDPSKPSFVVFASNHYPWYHVGAEIKAWFKTNGNVYIARNNTIPGQKNQGADTIYTNLAWSRLSPELKEYPESYITAKSCYWVKFEFSGKGSGLDSAEVSSELQMSRYAMPGLEYGKNFIRFIAKNMGGSSAKITYNYDDQSTYYFYEPATSPTGKHIYHRLGGKLQQTGGFWKKAAFWSRLKDSANVTANVSVRIFNGQNTSNIRCVRTLFANKPLHWGYYWWYWDGKDDKGALLPPGMYVYRIETDKDTNPVHAAFVYLYPDGIWPLPNELRSSAPSIDGLEDTLHN